MHGVQSTPRLRSNRRRPGSWPKKTDPQPVDFGDLARFAYPVKTIESLGFATKAPRSTIKTWLNGSARVPGWVLALVTAEIMKRLAHSQR